MATNVKVLAESMLNTARPLVGDRWFQERHVARLELRLLAESAAEIDQLLRQGLITPDRARQMFEIHRTSARSVLMTSKELADGSANAVIRAAVAVIARALRNGVTHN
jgi:hypothetical protein